jgi:hypothetical protein
MGLILYLIVLAWIWLLRFPKQKRDDLSSYYEWRQYEDDPYASYQQYFNSDSGPKAPLTRWEKTAIVTTLAVLILYFALWRWKALHDI